MNTETVAAILAPYIADLIENANDNGTLREHMRYDGVSAIHSGDITRALSAATRLAADLIHPKQIELRTKREGV